MAAAALLAILAACGSDDFPVTLRFEDAVQRTEVRTVEVALLDECGDLGSSGADAPSPLLSEVVSLPGPSPRLGRVEPGTYGLYARARDEKCHVVAAGCARVELEPASGRDLTVLLGAVDGPACRHAEGCQEGICQPCIPTSGWTQIIEASGSEPVFVAAGPDGAVAVVHNFNGTADLDPRPAELQEHVAAGEMDTAVVSLASDGSFRWARAITGEGRVRARAVSVCGDGSTLVSGELMGTATIAPGGEPVELVAPGYQNGFVVRFDEGGRPQWAWTLDAQTSGIGAVSCDATGAFALAGSFFDRVDLDPDPDGRMLLITEDAEDGFVAVFEPDGALRWAAGLHGSGTDRAMAAEIAPDGLGVVVTGEFGGTIDLDPDPVAERSYEDAGETYDLFLARLDGDGGLLWGRALPRSENPDNRHPKVAFTPGLEVVLAANVRENCLWPETGDCSEACCADPTSADVLVLRYRGDGALRWVRRLGGVGLEAMHGVAVARDGSTLLSAATYSSPVLDLDPRQEQEGGVDLYEIAGVPDAVISMLDADGSFVGGIGFGADWLDFGYDVATIPDGVGGGAVVATGSFHGTIDFDPGACDDLRTAPEAGAAYVMRIPIDELAFYDR